MKRLLLLCLLCGICQLVLAQTGGVTPPVVNTPPLKVGAYQAVIQLAGCSAVVSEKITYIVDTTTPPVSGVKHYVDMLEANGMIDVTVQGFTAGVDAITVFSEPDPVNEDQRIISWDFPPVTAPVTWRVNYTLFDVVRSYPTHNSFNFNLVNRGLPTPQMTSIASFQALASIAVVGQPWQITPNASTTDILGGTQFTWPSGSLEASDGFYVSISYPVQDLTCLGAPKRWAKEPEDGKSVLDYILQYWYLIAMLVICCVCVVLCIIGIVLLLFGVGGIGGGSAAAYKMWGGEEDFDY